MPATPAEGGARPGGNTTTAHDARLLRTALGRYATGVTIVACVDPASGAWVGLTCNSFGSLSLQPPLVQWSLREGRGSGAAFAAAPRFAVNVLTLQQVELARRFATRIDDRFAEGGWSLGRHGAPVLAGSAAVFECELLSQQSAGDHRLFIGRVLAFEETTQPPLVFQAGHYHELGDLL